MAVARFLDRMCLALRASGLWLRYATLQNLIPSFPWIAPQRPPPWRNPRKRRDQILPSGNLGGHRITSNGIVRRAVALKKVSYVREEERRGRPRDRSTETARCDQICFHSPSIDPHSGREASMPSPLPTSNLKFIYIHLQGFSVAKIRFWSCVPIAI